MIKVGILFGGPSREREISFAGGRTVYDNLNKSIFEPVPIFIDSLKNFILLDWEYIYKGTIRDFYPPIESLPPSKHQFQIYMESLGELSREEQDVIISKIGKRIDVSDLSSYFDVAFLALHGEYGEDGQIQGLLESLEIPYTGSGIKACSIGMDKAFQKKIMDAGNFASPKVNIINKKNWNADSKKNYFTEAKNVIGFPLVVRPANQGSSIGVSILDTDTTQTEFEEIVDNAFFIRNLQIQEWAIKSDTEKEDYIRAFADIRSGVGFPVKINNEVIYHPEDLMVKLDTISKNTTDKCVRMESLLSEQKVIIEAFIHGKEFSCIVAKLENGDVVSLPPTEVVKGEEIFDYRSKYMPGLSRKLTPINLPIDQINLIRSECKRLFEYLEFNTYARIDGFITINKTVILNDPNTTSGMLPSSFFFHQAAEIGLNPSQFLSYIIRTSIQERIETALNIIPKYEVLLKDLDRSLKSLQGQSFQKKKVGVILGGYSAERHVSVDSGRNIYEKLASSEKYEPIPIFLTGDDSKHDLYQIPINLLLKDNADDIKDKIENYAKHPVIEDIKAECISITSKYASENVIFGPKAVEYEDLIYLVDQVFIAVHGRPGEDGQIQRKLDELKIPYNGSNEQSSQITINKYKTLHILKDYGFTVTNQFLVEKMDFAQFPKETIKKIENKFDYPFIAKPVDDGCSAAVKMIKTQNSLKSFLKAMFRDEEALSKKLTEQLELQPKEEFPQKEFVLIEELITARGANHFLETTTGLLTHIKDGEIEYEVFEPSETLSGGEILSLEEKFLAGEGQNITPARFADNEADYKVIAAQVKADLKKAAQILGIKGYSRIDAFVRIFDNNKAETIIIEVNSLPGMTPATCIFHQAAINNYKPYEFIDKILDFGVKVMEY